MGKGVGSMPSKIASCSPGFLRSNLCSPFVALRVKSCIKILANYLISKSLKENTIHRRSHF